MLIPRLFWLWIAAVVSFPALGDERPTRHELTTALRRGTEFFHGSVAQNGGYVYAYSTDLSLSEGEGTTDDSTVWVQPPGTPTVAEAFLDAYEATGDDLHLAAARDAAHALLLGQFQSGGWYYSIRFDPAEREKMLYRLDLEGRPLPEQVSPRDRASNGGWDVWRRRKYEGNLTILDDDVTQAATRFLIRLDRTLDFKEPAIHNAALLALKSLLHAQYPNGAWSASYDRLQESRPSAIEYPIRPASYPDSWPRTWPKDFRGCYVTNDDLVADAINTMLLAYDVHRDEAYLNSAKQAGDFLLLAQMPAPQPVWAQQYDKAMQPCWSRVFEPPAISGGESQAIIAVLLRLTEATGDDTYLEPIPRAIAYLKASRLPDGRLARFYELETNRPIYFTRGKDRRHELTYDDNRIATGYSYILDSRLVELQAEFDRVKARRASHRSSVERLATEAKRVLAAQDERGAWPEPGRLRHHKIEPPGGIISSATFAENVATLCRYLDETKP